MTCLDFILLHSICYRWSCINSNKQTKMKKTLFTSTLLFCFLLFAMKNLNYDGKALELTKQMVKKIQTYKTFKFTLTKYERIKGKMVQEKLNAKIQARPLNVYSFFSIPVDGREVLFKSGSNDGKALINPGEFPWVNLNLDPQGSLMRKDQHHAIFAFDFNYLVAFLEHLLNKYADNAENMVEIKGEVQWDKRPCYHIEMNNPNYKLESYTVQNEKNLIEVAKNLKVNEYTILSLNKNVSNYYDIESGQKLTVPNDYAKRMTLYLDKEYLIPVMVKVYDSKGLYEHFEYTNLEVNPNISQEEFSADYKGYSF